MTAQSLCGRTAVVTGAGKGIGCGIARELAAAGAAVVINYSASAEGSIAVRDGILANGGRAMIFQADVSQQEQAAALMQAAVDWTGQLDILVCNAALQANVRLPEYRMETYDKLVAVNLGGYFLCTREAARHMKPRHRGIILYNSSVHAQRPTEFDPVYCMTKGGIRMLEREAAIELAPHGIRVLCMEPGGVRIEAQKSGNEGPFIDEKYLSVRQRYFRFRSGRMLGRAMVPEDIGKMAAILAGDDCELISGCEIRMDGADMLY